MCLNVCLEYSKYSVNYKKDISMEICAIIQEGQEDEKESYISQKLN